MPVASLLFGISASLDALLVGAGYGLRGIRIRLWQNLAISLVTLFGTCLSVGLGHRLAAMLPGTVGTYAGSLILVILGLYYIVKWTAAQLRERRRKAWTQRAAKYRGGNPVEREIRNVSSRDSLPCLSLPEVFTLSLTLSLNNLSAGLSASLTGLPLMPTAIATLACSVLFLSSGNRLGGFRMFRLAGRAADPLSGLLLIGLGLVQLF